MKDENRKDPIERDGGRRRFLGLLTGAGALALAMPLLRRGQRPRELSLKEAELYRKHDLAG